MEIEKCNRCIGDAACQDRVMAECLPVPYFGNVLNPSLKVATIGLNPAYNEYFLKGGDVAKDRSLRLALLADYGRSSRVDLNDANMADAITRRLLYFQDSSRDWHPYFEKMESVINRVNPNWTYFTGSAVHIDVVACTLKERWGALSRSNPDALNAVVSNCREHFSSTINNLRSGTIILCDGHRAWLEIASLGFSLVSESSKRINEHGDVGRVGVLHCNGKEFPVRGWSSQVNFLTAFWRFNLAAWVQSSFKTSKVEAM